MSRVFFSTQPRFFLLAITILSVPLSSPVSAATVAISGAPSLTGTVGQSYSFTPAVTPKSTTEKFYIGNKPSWATFDATTGRLSGTPTAAGNTNRITIGVSEGRAFAWLPVFVINIKAASSGGSTGSGGTTNTKPTISGSPSTVVTEGNTYTFTPSAKDANGDKLTFSVQNRPSWAGFSTTTGTLSGTPTSANVGTYSNIVISVSDGKSSAALSPFAIAVDQTSGGSAQVSWSPPSQNSDGSTLTNLAGYRIYYGTVKTNLTKMVQIANPGIATYLVSNLSAGTWYFSVAAYNSSGAQRADSLVGSLTIMLVGGAVRGLPRTG